METIEIDKLFCVMFIFQNRNESRIKLETKLAALFYLSEHLGLFNDEKAKTNDKKIKIHITQNYPEHERDVSPQKEEISPLFTK